MSESIAKKNTLAKVFTSIVRELIQFSNDYLKFHAIFKLCCNSTTQLMAFCRCWSN